jgi:hypothetical protein
MRGWVEGGESEAVFEMHAKVSGVRAWTASSTEKQ